MNKYQSIAVVCAIVALVVLFFAPTKSSQLVPAHLHAEGEHEENHSHEMSDDLDMEVEKALETIRNSSEGSEQMAGIMKLKKVLEKDPNHPGALKELGYFSMQTGQFEKAITRFEALYQLDSENKEAVFMLAKANDSLGKVEEAVSYYQLFLKLYPDYPQASEVKERIEKLTE